jgi:magnesium transporter
MVRIFFHKNNTIEKIDDETLLHRIPKEQLLWVDLQFPIEEEQHTIESFFNINFCAQQEASDLESNSRFYETERFIYINSNFMSKRENYYENCPVVFYLLDGILITKRNADLASFGETVKKIKRNQKAFKNGSEILEGILETKVDLDSDYMESISKEIAQVGKNLSKDTTNEENILLKINSYQESTMFLREGFVDKLRVVSSLIKSSQFANTTRLKILIKDINSMLEFSSFIFKRLEYLQNTLMGLINIEQNKAIKIFTIVSVVFMPPTLIASIYGMNFKSMPELNWNFGYPLAIMLIIGSSLFTLFIFKRKKWL